MQDGKFSHFFSFTRTSAIRFLLVVESIFGKKKTEYKKES